MATTNDITGDSIKSKVNSKAYVDNWDRIFGKKEVEPQPQPQPSFKYTPLTRIIFLDFDGVINSVSGMGTSHRNSQHDHYQPELIHIVNEMIKDTGALVVVSSTWRKDNTIESMQTLCDEMGLVCTVIGQTPTLGRGSLRGNEIRMWIEDNIEGSSCDYYNYVIIDDDSDMLLWQKDHFFSVDPYTGITPSIAYRVGRFFNKFKTGY